MGIFMKKAFNKNNIISIICFVLVLISAWGLFKPRKIIDVIPSVESSEKAHITTPDLDSYDMDGENWQKVKNAILNCKYSSVHKINTMEGNIYSIVPYTSEDTDITIHISDSGRLYINEKEYSYNSDVELFHLINQMYS